MMLFIKPPLSVYKNIPQDYYYAEEVSTRTYAEYNYLRPGFASWIKLRHFEVCLRLTRNYFGKCSVIDFGCADGIFLPSLSKYFKNVVGIDQRQDFITISTTLINSLKLTNVHLICNDNITMDGLRNMLPQDRYGILYLLETIEHVGERDSPWEARITFLKSLAMLLDPESPIVLSVPNMVGISFLLQRIGLALLRAHREPISFRNLLKASLLNDTKELEQQWDGPQLGRHLGFNHIHLERHMRNHFHIAKKSSTVFQTIYVLRRNT